MKEEGLETLVCLCGRCSSRSRDSSKVCKSHNYATSAMAMCVCCPRERSDLDLVHSSVARGSEAKIRKNQVGFLNRL